jgi:transposase
MSRITFQKETVKQLQAQMGQAYHTGNIRLVRHLAALAGIAQGEGLTDLLELWHISQPTAYHGLKDFVEQCWDSLTYTPPSGRPARLTKGQKQQLYAAVQAGPEAAGYPCGCWTTVMIQEWIYQQLGVTYSRFYVAELLHNLGLSYQKARFVSAHLDEEKRKEWIETVWPAILAKLSANTARFTLKMRSVLPKGAPCPIPGRREAVNRRSKPVGCAKGTRSWG